MSERVDGAVDVVPESQQRVLEEERLPQERTAPFQQGGLDRVVRVFTRYMRALKRVYTVFDEAEQVLVSARQGQPTCVSHCGRCCVTNVPTISTAEAAYIASNFWTITPAWQGKITRNLRAWVQRKAGDPIPRTLGRAMVQRAHGPDVRNDEWDTILPWTAAGKAARGLSVESRTPRRYYQDIGVADADATLDPDSDPRFGPEQINSRASWIVRREPCPFLGDEAEGSPCMIHEFRPLPCRAYSMTTAPGSFCQRPLVGTETETKRMFVSARGSHPALQRLRAEIIAFGLLVNEMVGKVKFGMAPWLVYRALFSMEAIAGVRTGQIAPERTVLLPSPPWVLTTEQVAANEQIGIQAYLQRAGTDKKLAGPEAAHYAQEEITKDHQVAADLRPHDLRKYPRHPLG